MKKIFFGFLVLAFVLVALGFDPSQVTQVYACKDGKACEDAPGQQDSGHATEDASTGAGNASGGQDPVGGNAGSVDPCVTAGNCGNGDHGKGNPVNGSLHANCRAAHGEVDPICLPTPPAGETPSVVVTPPIPPVVTGTPEPGDDDKETPVIVVDGEQVDFEPYKAPFVRSGLVALLTSGRVSEPAVAACPKDCCCECQNFDWLKPWMIYVVLGALVVIALALVALVFIKVFGRWLFLLALVVATPIVIFVVIRLLG